MKQPTHFDSWSANIDIFVELATRQDVHVGLFVGLATILLAWSFGLIPRGLGKLISLNRRRKVSAYISAISFTEAEILLALKDYVKPKCTRVDPSRCDEPRNAISESDEDLYKFVDEFIESGERKHLFIYADSGMGKTTFLINYFHRNNDRKFSKKKDMVLVSLAKPTCEVEISGTPLERQRATVLLLDALDEDRYIYGDTAARVARLFELSANYRAIVVTCRSQFFLNDEALPVFSGVPRAGPTPLAAESKEYAVERVYISPLNDKQIGKYLRSRFPGLFGVLARRRAKVLVERVPYLPVRPMLLTHISDVLASHKEIRTRADIYQAIVSSWAQRELRWIAPGQLMDFSSDLALELYLGRSSRGDESCTVAEIDQLAKASNLHIETSVLTGRSLLNRTSGGAFKFSHRSILEYFVAQRIAGAAAGLSLQLTDQMLVFLIEVLGVSDGRTEINLSRRPAVLQVISPALRLGYSTNFNLFKQSERILQVHALMSAPISVLATHQYDGELFSDLVTDVLLRLGNRLAELRVAIPLSSAGYMDCYISAWTDELCLLSHTRIDAVSLRAAVGFELDGEVCLVGSGAFTERMDWHCEFRSDLRDLNVDVARVESNARISIFKRVGDDGLEVRLISGRPVSGPLAAFGILSGGSYLPVERNMFARLQPTVAISNPRVGTILVPEDPKMPAAERWPKR